MSRLPVPGGDNGNWGTILNDYLSQVHKPDGTLKDNTVTSNTIAPNSVTNAAIATDAVNAASIADGSITEALLTSSVQTKLNTAAPTWSTLSGKPTVIAAGADAGAAREAIGAAQTTLVRDVREFLQTGESWDSTGGTDMSVIMQRAMNALGVLYTADTASTYGQAGYQLYVPAGRVRIESRLIAVSGVGILGAGPTATIFYPVGDNAFIWGAEFNTGDTTVRYDLTFSHFGIDGALQERTSYDSSVKGFFIQNCQRVRIDTVHVKNTYATGFGLDYIRDYQYINLVAENCGRGKSQPGGETGGSGAGIGIAMGVYPVEAGTIINCQSRNNTTAGFYFEKLTDDYYSKGVSVIGGEASGNYFGVHDAGACGLIVSGMQIFNNQHSGFRLDGGAAHPNGGQGGNVSACQIYGNGGDRPTTGGGIAMRNVSGSYQFSDNDIYSNAGPGVRATETAVLASRIAFEGNRVHDNAGAPFDIAVSATKLHIDRNRTWNNLGPITLTGTFTGVSRQGNRFEEGVNDAGATFVDQIDDYEEPSGLVWADDFVGDAGSLLYGRIAGDGLLQAGWTTAPAPAGSRDFELDGSGYLRAKTGSVPTFGTIAATANGHTEWKVGTALLAGNNRRFSAIFRYVDENNHWRITARPSSGVYTWALQKVVAGTATTVDAMGPTATVGDVVRVEPTGSSIVWKVNGSTIATVVDSVNDTAIRVGISGQFSSDPTSSWDYIRHYIP